MYRQQGECEEPCLALVLTFGSAVTLDMLCCVVRKMAALANHANPES